MIYFDNSATTKIDKDVLGTYVKVSENYYGNPSSLHQLGETASKLLEQSRKQIADVMNIKPNEVFFTSGGTEGDNWAIKGTAYEKERYGKHLITTSVEHSAVIETMKDLENRGWEITFLPVDASGHISIADLKNAIRPDTVLVSVIAVNNEIGAIQPLKEIGEVLENYPGIHYHVDAVQAVGKVSLPLGQDNRIDMAVFSAHKFHGPRGVGFIYKKEGRQLTPILNGGGQETDHRSGTENLPAIASMAKALRLLYEDKDRKIGKIQNIHTYIRNEISEKENTMIFSPEKEAPHILCFGIKEIRGEVAVHAFEDSSIYLSTTSACSSRNKSESSTLLAMAIPQNIAETAVRISFSEINTMEEAEEFVQVFNEVHQKFKKINIKGSD